MKNNIMISIVLPVYNGERYLDESIGSCIAQTHQNFELLIIDDKSTDGSLAIARNWAQRDTRIKIIHNEKNLKLPSSLNRGFEEAKGDYFTWTSDDNFYEPCALSKMLESIYDVDFVYSHYWILDENKNKKTRERPPKLYCQNIFIINIIGACFLYKAEIHKAVQGYSPNLLLYEDYDFWLKAYTTGFKFKLVNEFLYTYRIHPNSLSSTMGAVKIEEGSYRLSVYYALKAQKRNPSKWTLPALEALLYRHNFFTSEEFKAYVVAMYKTMPLKFIMYLPLAIWKCFIIYLRRILGIV
ncbi:MAG: glycosyltransferase [Synergistaceae bacterium]|jgi:glycosyltransferase involved in cell wall biosynthesis|nr:glycosyltransferase [Synergistaceae bacterium]